MNYLIAVAIIAILGFLGWKMTSRTNYESAAYDVLDTDGAFELREYPDLMLATTDMGSSPQGRDGSFGRLFRYISGGNRNDQKVAMTTPVFMERDRSSDRGQMGFVIPSKFAPDSIPSPTNDDVAIQRRDGGRFAVLRFSGRLDAANQTAMEARLRDWIASRELTGGPQVEFAGYDPPWTPGPFRRNEVLIRVQ